MPINEHLHWSLVVVYMPGEWAKEERKRRGFDDAVVGEGDAVSSPEPDADTEEDDDDEEAGGQHHAQQQRAQPSQMAVPAPDEEEMEDDVEEEEEEEVAEAPAAEAPARATRKAAKAGASSCDAIALSDEEEEGTKAAVPQPPKEKEPCILYLDSLNNSPQKYLNLIKVRASHCRRWLGPGPLAILPPAPAIFTGPHLGLCLFRLPCAARHCRARRAAALCLHRSHALVVRSRPLPCSKTYLHLEYEEKVLKLKLKEGAPKAEAVKAEGSGNVAAERQGSQAQGAGSSDERLPPGSQGSDVQVTGETRPKFNASSLDYRTDVGSAGETLHLFHGLRTGYLEVWAPRSSASCGIENARACDLTPSSSSSSSRHARRLVVP